MDHPAVDALLAELTSREWVGDVWLHGSLATGDHQPGVSDIDVVATTTHPLDPDRMAELARVDRSVDVRWPRSALGCAYVAQAHLSHLDAQHPTWTHGRLVHRPLSAMVRAELLDHGQVLRGREPADVLDPMSTDDVAEGVRAELRGYWSWAVRRPWLFLGPSHADLALLSMARARVALATGELITKTEATAHLRAPAHIVDGLRRRRAGSLRPSPFAPILAHHAWHDTRRTIAEHAR